MKEYFRPKTRGELRDKLVEGIACEVVSSNAEITTAMLHWLDCCDYDVTPSENEGWSLFTPTNQTIRSLK